MAMKLARPRRSQTVRALALPARPIPPWADARHALVIAVHDLNGSSVRNNVGLGRGGSADVLEQALMSPEAADTLHLDG